MTWVGSPLSYLLLALAGAALMASFSATIVAAQEVIYQNAPMAAGLMLGFGIGIGGLGVGLMGLLIEHMCIGCAIHGLVWFPFLAGLFGLSIKGNKTPVLFQLVLDSPFRPPCYLNGCPLRLPSPLQGNSINTLKGWKS